MILSIWWCSAGWFFSWSCLGCLMCLQSDKTSKMAEVICLKLAQLGCSESWASFFFPCKLRASLSPEGFSRRIAGHFRWQFKAPTSAKVEAASAMFRFRNIPLVKVGHRARMIQCGRVSMRVWTWGHMVPWGHLWRIATTHSDTIPWGQENWKRYRFEERRAFKLNFE